MHKGFAKNFLDVLVLAELKERSHMGGGYDVISFIHEKFHVLISSGTIYPRLYSLERAGLVRDIEKNGKRIYELTSKGQEAVVGIVNDSRVFLDYLSKR